MTFEIPKMGIYKGDLQMYELKLKKKHFISVAPF